VKKRAGMSGYKNGKTAEIDKNGQEYTNRYIIDGTPADRVVNFYEAFKGENEGGKEDK
jgi:hypothetical protein